jgi:shikimate dehydrogenase
MSQKFILAGVMGWPVAHSRSPLIHNHWIAQYKLHGAYGHFPVQPNHLETAIRGLSALGLAGCNITIPHKVTAMQFVDWVDPHAQKVGAINTIVVQPDGALHGYNNDGFGYTQSIREKHPQWQPKDQTVVILGAGGACRAILVALLEEGVGQIRLLNRTLSKAQELAQEFGPKVLALDWSERHSALADAQLLVNTTSQGMQGHAPLDIELHDLPVSALVSDIVYTPLDTPLLAAAQQKGNPTIQGLGMLVHQARPAFKSWFGVMPSVSTELYSALFKTL